MAAAIPNGFWKNSRIVGRGIAVGIEQPNGVDRGIQLI
jgi:hypothetical protein